MPGMSISESSSIQPPNHNRIPDPSRRNRASSDPSMTSQQRSLPDYLVYYYLTRSLRADEGSSIDTVRYPE